MIFCLLLLYTVFAPQYGWVTGWWYAMFHAISAFCNAGFDIMGPAGGGSLTTYEFNPVVNTVIMLLIIIGGLSGFFVVPMNALLQHRGHILMGAGHSIAVQNFNENISILVMTGLYYMMIKMDISIYWVVTMFGLFVSGLMYMIRQRHLANQAVQDDVQHLDDTTHH